MEHKQITIDAGTLLQEEQPQIRAYLERKMELVPPSGVTRETFRAVVQELSELMFVAGIRRVMTEMRQSAPAVDIDGMQKKEVCS